MRTVTETDWEGAARRWQAEAERLRKVLVKARSMLHTVNACRSHECVDCREWAGIRMRECDAALAETGERAS